MDLPARVEAFIAPSRFLRDKFIEFDWPPGRLVHCRNFLEGHLLSGRRANAASQDRDSFGLYLGQLEPWKGLGTLLEACTRHRELRLGIAGRGGQEDELRALVRDRGLGKIDFLGFLSGQELHAAIDAAGFVVVPSECYENCPYSVMEAMARGKPVLASRIGGLPELVLDGETGLLFDPGDEEALAGRMKLLASDAGLRERLGARAAEFAREELCPERHYERIMEIYSRPGRMGQEAHGPASGSPGAG
jgi:glycosyltransferase involved in cell wall biosynthesis